MPPTPIYDVIYILRNAIRDALVPLMSAAPAPSGPPVGISYLDSAGRAKCYWVQAEQEDANKVKIVLPWVIAQSQDNGGAAVKTVGALAWSGLVTVRAAAGRLGTAETLMSIVTPGMQSLSATGYQITTAYERPITIPPGDAWQCGHIWRVTISA